MTYKFITSFLTLFTFLAPVNNIGYSSQSNIIDKSDVLSDLTSDPSFNFSDYQKNAQCQDEFSIKDITIVKSSNSLFLYLFNENGKDLEKNLNCFANLSFTEDYSDTSRYFCSIVNKSDDCLFYKFKFSLIDTTEISQVHISDINFNFVDGSSQHNTIGSSYFFNDGEMNPYLKKELDVINLSINPGHYRFNTINGNGFYTDLFYITFNLKNNLGDLIGIKLAWQENHTDIVKKIDIANPLNSYVLDNSYVSDLITMEYTNKDLLNINSLSSIGSSFSKFVFNFNPKYWFTDKSTDYENIPVIEKINYDKANYSSFDGYYLNDETIQSLNSQYWNLLGSNRSNYVIRFSIADFIFENELNHQRNIKTEIINCDVLTLTFCEDGKVYTLMVSSKPVDYDPGNEIPENNLPDWLTRVKQFISIILLIGLVIALFPIIVNIIIPICKLIIKVISLPFKAMSKACKKKKNKK